MLYYQPEFFWHNQVHHRLLQSFDKKYPSSNGSLRAAPLFYPLKLSAKGVRHQAGALVYTVRC